MSNLIPVERIENKIYLIRGQKVMLDRDLAEKPKGKIRYGRALQEKNRMTIKINWGENHLTKDNNMRSFIHSSWRRAMSQRKFLRCSSFLTARGGGRRGCVFSNLVLVLVLLLSLNYPTFASDLSLDDIIKNLQSNQSKIKDMYAETTTKITSNLQLTTDNTTGPQTMVQKGKMWTKGESKSKIEMLSPMKQITITNGDQMAIVNPDSGQKVTQDLKKLKGQGSGGKGQGEMDIEKAKEFFDLSVARSQTPDAGKMQYVITGVPKKENKFLGKMEFYVDSERWVPVKILMYDGKGKPMSQSEIEYKRETTDEGRGTIWVPIKNVSNVTTPMGAMKIEMEFEKLKINQGIKDEEFKIE